MRIREIEYLRGLAIIAVVAIHVTALGLTHNFSTFDIFINLVSRFCVPLFLFIAGIVLIYKYDEKTFSYRKFITKRLKDIGIPYLIWSFIGFTMFLIGNPFSIRELLLTFLLGSGRLFYHLYYIPLLFQCYFLLPLVLKYIDKKYFVLGTGLLQTSILFVYQTSFLQGNHIIPGFLVQVFVGSWFFYFVLGCWIGKNLNKWTKKIQEMRLSLVTGLFLFGTMVQFSDFYFSWKVTSNYADSSNFLRPSIILYFLLSLPFLYRVSNIAPLKRIMYKIGEHSFSIYLGHLLVIIAVHSYISPWNIFFISIVICISAHMIYLKLLPRLLRRKGSPAINVIRKTS